MENLSSQRSKLYHHAIISYYCCSYEISVIVFIVSHGFYVRQLQGFARAELEARC